MRDIRRMYTLHTQGGLTMALVKITISVEEENLAVIDKAADKMRQSRSGYLEITALERAKKDLE